MTELPQVTELPKVTGLNTSAQNTPSPEDVRDWDNRNLVHPWHSMGVDDADFMIASGAKGIYVYDATGQRYIDGPGGMWNTQIGYGRQEMADAIANQIVKLPFNSPWSSTSEPAAELAAKLAAESPGDLNNVFFTTGGSTAVDSALRFVHFYNNLRGRPEKKHIIARQKGYHGSTFLAASVSGKERDKTFLDTDTKSVHFIGNVNPYIRPEGMSVEAWCDAKITELEAKILEVGADRIAAFIAEPILASGGVIVPPEGYHKRCLETCRKYEVIYISDEVVTGFGRLGEFFASQNVFDITPDIITCAKGITSGYVPLGAMLISDRLLADIQDKDRANVLFSNGFTYSGHPVSCVAALKNIEIMEREGIFAHVREITPYFQERLQDLRRHSIVGDARGMGLLGCVEGAAPSDSSPEKRLQVDKEFGQRLDDKCEARGLLLRPIINMCVFSPPLIISRDQIDAMFDIIDEALGEVNAEMA